MSCQFYKYGSLNAILTRQTGILFSTPQYAISASALLKGSATYKVFINDNNGVTLKVLENAITVTQSKLIQYLFDPFVYDPANGLTVWAQDVNNPPTLYNAGLVTATNLNILLGFYLPDNQSDGTNFIYCSLLKNLSSFGLPPCASLASSAYNTGFEPPVSNGSLVPEIILDGVTYNPTSKHNNQVFGADVNVAFNVSGGTSTNPFSTNYIVFGYADSIAPPAPNITIPLSELSASLIRLPFKVKGMKK